MKNTLLQIFKSTPFYGPTAAVYKLIEKRLFILHVEAEANRLLRLPLGEGKGGKKGKLNIVQFSTYDNVGGAALVARRLHSAFERIGNSETMFVGEEHGRESGVVCIKNPEKDYLKKKLCDDHGLLYMNIMSSFDIPAMPRFKEADIIHMHNLHGEYFNYMALPGLTRLKPSVWTLHDMQAITGHCAFSLDCNRWESGCGKCPLLKVYPALEKDTTAYFWKLKKKLYAKSDVDIVVPSKWLYDAAKKSILSEKNIRLIYNGIDTELFRPLNKAELRRKYGVPEHSPVFITSAVGGINNPQKGGKYLLEALGRIRITGEVVVVSLGTQETVPVIKGVKWINAGHVFEEARLAELYSLADIFLYPSLADNCPLVVLEAMSCGLPVVTFDTGGIPELVKHMKTGYVAPYKDAEGLVAGMELFIKDKTLRQSAATNARQEIEASFTAHKMAKSYLDLYYEIVDRRARKSHN